MGVNAQRVCGIHAASSSFLLDTRPRPTVSTRSVGQRQRDLAGEAPAYEARPAPGRNRGVPARRRQKANSYHHPITSPTHLLALASVGEDAFDEVGRHPEIGREKSVNVWAHGGDNAFPFGGEEDSEGSDDRDAEGLREASRRTIVDYQEIGVGFQCETDGFALSWPERGTQHLRAEGLCERPLVNPCGSRPTGRGLSRHGGRDEQRGEEPL